MRRFVLGWKTLGHEQRLGRDIVNYADDFVICCRGTADEAASRDAGHDVEAEADGERDEDARLPACRRRRSTFWGTRSADATRRRRDAPTSGTVPSKKRVARLCEAISEMTGRDGTLLDSEDLVGGLNRMLIGWANYFCLGPVSKAYRAVDRHVRKRLRQWLCAKHKVWGPGTKRFPEASLHQRLGLVCLAAADRAASRGRPREPFSESRMREIRPSGSMSGVWKRSMVGLVRHRQTKGPETDRPNLNHRATSRLHKLEVLARYMDDNCVYPESRSYFDVGTRNIVSVLPSSLGIDGRVFCADAFESVIVFVAVNTRIRAEDIDFVDLGQVVEELLKPDRLVQFAFCP